MILGWTNWTKRYIIKYFTFTAGNLVQCSHVIYPSTASNLVQWTHIIYPTIICLIRFRIFNLCSGYKCIKKNLLFHNRYVQIICTAHWQASLRIRGVLTFQSGFYRLRDQHFHEPLFLDFIGQSNLSLFFDERVA